MSPETWEASPTIRTKKGSVAAPPWLGKACACGKALLIEGEHRHNRGGLIEAALPHADRTARHNGDVLLAVDRVADRRRRDRGADIEAPQFLERVGVIGGELAVHMPGKEEVGAGAGHTGF